MFLSLRTLSALFIAWSFGAFSCSDNSDRKLPSEDVSDVAVELVIADVVEDTEVAEAPCKVVWSREAFTSGAITHPARGKNGEIYVSSFGKLHALESTGLDLWVWPDDDTVGAVEPMDVELYTPVIGLEGSLIMGTGQPSILVVNRNGSGRLTVPTDGLVSGAPAISADQRILALTDNGALMHIKDLGQANGLVVWSHEGDECLPNAMTGLQPIIGPMNGDGSEPLLVLTKDALRSFIVSNGDLTWTYPLPEGVEASSNPIMTSNGDVLFVGRLSTVDEVSGASVVTHPLFRVDVQGNLVEGYPRTVHTGPTRIISLSEGEKEAVLLGTSSSGLIVYSLSQNQRVFQYLGTESFQDVAQPAQGNDGLIYFSAHPHWLFVVSETGEALWQKDLSQGNESIGSILSPSSPMVLQDGPVLFHSGNLLLQVQCSDAGPSVSDWPRFGGNEKNTGNISD